MSSIFTSVDFRSRAACKLCDLDTFLVRPSQSKFSVVRSRITRRQSATVPPAKTSGLRVNIGTSR